MASFDPEQTFRVVTRSSCAHYRYTWCRVFGLLEGRMGGVTTDLNPFRDVDLRPLRSRLAGWSGLESTLLDTAKLANLARKLGFGHFNEADIHALWRIGLVRADITIAQAPAQIPGLELVQSASDVRFTDVRKPKARPTGSPSFVPKGETAEDALTPYFHPYRIFLLHHVVRTFEVSTSNTQYLLWTPGVLSVVESQLLSLNHWTESKAFFDRFDHWNWACELAIVCEPVRWTRRETDNEDPERCGCRTTGWSFNHVYVRCQRTRFQALVKRSRWRRGN